MALPTARYESLGVHSPAVDLLNGGNRRRTGVSGSCELTLNRDAPEESTLPASDLDHNLAAIHQRDAQTLDRFPSSNCVSAIPLPNDDWHHFASSAAVRTDVIMANQASSGPPARAPQTSEGRPGFERAERKSRRSDRSRRFDARSRDLYRTVEIVVRAGISHQA